MRKILDRVLTWPAQRQEAAAHLLNQMEQQHTSSHRLSDEQIAEVENRRTDFIQGRERYASDDEMAALWRKCGL